MWVLIFLSSRSSFPSFACTLLVSTESVSVTEWVCAVCFEFCISWVAIVRFSVPYFVFYFALSSNSFNILLTKNDDDPGKNTMKNTNNINSAKPRRLRRDRGLWSPLPRRAKRVGGIGNSLFLIVATIHFFIITTYFEFLWHNATTIAQGEETLLEHINNFWDKIERKIVGTHLILRERNLL